MMRASERPSATTLGSPLPGPRGRWRLAGRIPSVHTTFCGPECDIITQREVSSPSCRPQRAKTTVVSRPPTHAQPKSDTRIVRLSDFSAGVNANLLFRWTPSDVFRDCEALRTWRCPVGSALTGGSRQRYR
ncbi:hypothetical protein PsYK624_133620 [Phanerochaete sordida]|uniref:Uncharacterized protein n=1 Tax=Phanerochaete sordida TaxID=48140 RepID=A0A9P3LJ94_9APHY|nr:hypothetical protein PsYK624_133620 [Phanerochaete sordida]